MEEQIGRREGRWAWVPRRRVRSAARAGPFVAQGKQARPLRGRRLRVAWELVVLLELGGSQR